MTVPKNNTAQCVSERTTQQISLPQNGNENPQIPPPPRVSAICENSNNFSTDLVVGGWVKVCTQRANREQYNGATGQVRLITNHDITYVVIGRACPCFYRDELQAIAAEEVQPCS